MKTEEPQLLNIHDSALFLGINTSTLRRWAYAKKLHAVKVGSRGDWRFTKQELSKMISVDKEKYSRLKKFLTEYAQEIQKASAQKHEMLVGNTEMPRDFRKHKAEHVEVVKKLAQYLEDVEKGKSTFNELGEKLAKKSIQEGLSLEEAVDGLSFIKQAIWEKLKEKGFVNEFTTQDFYTLSYAISTYTDILASKTAFAYHTLYTSEKEKEKLKLYELFLQAPIPIAIISCPNFIFELSNPANNQALGKEILPGKALKELFPEAKDILKFLEKVYKTGKPIYISEYPFQVKREGKDYTEYVNVIYHPLKNEQNKVYAIMTTGVPVTEQVFAKQKTQIAAAIIESSDDAIIGLSSEGVISSWNKGAQRLYNYSEKEMLGKTTAVLMPPNKQDDFPMIMSKLEKGQKVEHYESQRMKKDGTVIEVSVTMSPIKNDAGEVIGASKIARDITAQKKNEENIFFLSESSKVLSSSLDYQNTLNSVAKLAVPQIADWCAVDMLVDGKLELVAIAHKDPDKVKWAKELREKFPINMEDQTGTAAVVKTGKAQFYPQITDQMLKQAARNKKELSLFRRLQFTSAVVVPICTDRNCIGTITFVTTETKRQYTKTDLAMAEELAARASLAIKNAKLYTEIQDALKLRDEFINMASHELKTPITSMKMYIQFLNNQLKRSDTNTQYLTILSKIDNQSEKLNSLIASLLNLSRIKTGKLHYEKQVFAIDDLIQEVVDSIQATTQKHQLIIENQTGKKIFADKDRIGQVLINLINNAIKFSPKANKIIISSKASRDKIIVSIQDFGIGISKNDQQKVFERFYQVNDPNEKTYPGLGIGLYISHEIVETHEGKLWVESDKGKGSRFSFMLPVINEEKTS